MTVAAFVSTKGGPGKTTVGANLGAFCADAGLRTLLIDLDTQPSLSSFYTLTHEAPGGTYQLIANNETRADQVIFKTCILPPQEFDTGVRSRFRFYPCRHRGEDACIGSLEGVA